MKIDILHSFSIQMKTMQIKRNQKEAEVVLSIVCSKFKRKHDKNEFPLNIVEIRGICEDDYQTRKFPSLFGLKAMY
jgi:hypothetical protein